MFNSAPILFCTQDLLSTEQGYFELQYFLIFNFDGPSMHLVKSIAEPFKMHSMPSQVTLLPLHLFLKSTKTYFSQCSLETLA